MNSARSAFAIAGLIVSIIALLICLAAMCGAFEIWPFNPTR